MNRKLDEVNSHVQLCCATPELTVPVRMMDTAARVASYHYCPISSPFLHEADHSRWESCEYAGRSTDFDFTNTEIDWLLPRSVAKPHPVVAKTLDYTLRSGDRTILVEDVSTSYEPF